MGMEEKVIEMLIDRCVVLQKDGTERALTREDRISCFGWEGTLADWVGVVGACNPRNR